MGLGFTTGCLHEWSSLAGIPLYCMYFACTAPLGWPTRPPYWASAWVTSPHWGKVKEYTYNIKESSCLKKEFSITLNYSYSKGVRADLVTACVYCLDLREELLSALCCLDLLRVFEPWPGRNRSALFVCVCL